MPIGWIKPQSRGSIRGLAPGSYRVAGLRPNGHLLAAPSVIELPGRLTFGPRELEGAQLKEPLLSSPEAAR
jgi:hypothetical protein